MFKAAKEKLQREKEIKDGHGSLNWGLDQNGVPSWNRWGDD
jgi:hypothetical protein